MELVKRYRTIYQRPQKRIALAQEIPFPEMVWYVRFPDLPDCSPMVADPKKERTNP